MSGVIRAQPTPSLQRPPYRPGCQWAGDQLRAPVLSLLLGPCLTPIVPPRNGLQGEASCTGRTAGCTHDSVCGGTWGACGSAELRRQLLQPRGGARPRALPATPPLHAAAWRRGTTEWHGPPQPWAPRERHSRGHRTSKGPRQCTMALPRCPSALGGSHWSGKPSPLVGAAPGGAVTPAPLPKPFSTLCRRLTAQNFKPICDVRY